MGSQLRSSRVWLLAATGAAVALGALLAAPNPPEREAPTSPATDIQPTLVALPAARTPARPAAERPRAAAIAAAPMLTLDVQLRPPPKPGAAPTPAPAPPASLAPPVLTPAAVTASAAAAAAPPAIASPPATEAAKIQTDPSRKICLTGPAAPASLAPSAPRPLRLSFTPELSRPARDIAPKGPAPEVERQVRLSSLLAEVLEK